MNKDLYFLAILADALKAPNPKEALGGAIEEIRALGQTPEYKRGFSQFQRFMEEVEKNWRSKKREDIAFDQIRRLALQMAADLPEGDQSETKVILELIRSEPRWQEEFQKILKEMSKSKPTDRIPEIVLERNGQRIASIICEEVTKEIKNLKPGIYTVKIDTGWVLWQEELTEQDLLWRAAFQGEDLDLAADSDEAQAHPTRQVSLLNDEVIIRVFPGAESGCIEISIKD